MRGQTRCAPGRVRAWPGTRPPSRHASANSGFSSRRSTYSLSVFTVSPLPILFAAKRPLYLNCAPELGRCVHPNRKICSVEQFFRLPIEELLLDQDGVPCFWHSHIERTGVLPGTAVCECRDGRLWTQDRQSASGQESLPAHPSRHSWAGVTGIARFCELTCQVSLSRQDKPFAKPQGHPSR